MKIRIAFCIIFFASLVSANKEKVVSHHEHRANSAHEHGSGEFNVVLAEKTLSVELHTPAESLVGFEHKAKSDNDKKKVSDIYKKLKDEQNVLMMPSSANCKLAKFEVEGEIFEDIPGLNVVSEEHEHGDHQDGHSDIEVRYVFECTNVANLKGMKVSLFKTLKNLKRLKVQTVINDKQNSADLLNETQPLPGF